MGARNPRIRKDDVGGRGSSDLQTCPVDDVPLFQLIADVQLKTVYLFRVVAA
jgi:hypothetical protein